MAKYIGNKKYLKKFELSKCYLLESQGQVLRGKFNPTFVV